MKKVSWGFTLVAMLALIALQLGWATPSVSAGPWPPVVYHRVQWGDNLFRISRFYGVSMHVIAWDNNIQNWHYIRAGDVLTIRYGPPPPPPPPAGRWYRILPGDTLYSIARRHGRTMQQIMNANSGQITNPNLIYAYRWIYIP